MKKNYVILIILIIASAAVSCGVFWYWQENKTLQVIEPIPSTSTGKWTPKPGDIFLPPSLPATTTYSNPAPNTTVQWNGNETLTSDLKLILGYLNTYDSSYSTEGGSFNYYEMGTHSGNKIILAIAPATDPSGPVLSFFEQTSAGYIFMEKMSASSAFYNTDTKQGYVLSSKITSADTTAFYKGIVGPENFTYRGINLEQQYLYPSDLFENYITRQKTVADISITKIDNVPAGDLYLYQQTYAPVTATNTSEKFYIKRYILKLPSSLYTLYNIKYDFFSDNLVPDITWNDGTKNQDTYHQDAHMGGCGNPGSSVISANSVSSLIKSAGTTGKGETIYEFKDANNDLVKFFYDLSGGSMYNQATGQMDKISIDSWFAHHPVVLYKNSLGEYVIFTNDKYGLQAECGKPVIYLYPKKPTNVQVLVGAKISKSEPSYNNGWNVLANPDGTLKTADGKIYDSLFWEGIGNGNYPEISEGFVVPQNELEITIKSQLKKLGLSEKESADFLDFWLAKMPKTPYVRLTWFTNQQLNVLAPLIILPKPDTIIRIFLDFQGLENPIFLPVQHLTSISRRGFTAVEWGGLYKK